MEEKNKTKDENVPENIILKKKITNKEDSSNDKLSYTKKAVSTFKTPEVVLLVVLTCFISLISGLFLEYKMMSKSTNDEALAGSLDPEIQEFIKNYNYVIDNYYTDVDKEELMNQAIKGMIDSLEDPHSVYMDEDESSAFNMQLEGSYTGLGVQIANNTNGDIIILSVFDGSPASRAGLKALDLITKVNDVDLKNKTANEFTTIVKNSKDNEFNLTINRDTVTSTIKVAKELVTIKSVFAKTYLENNKKIGYINVTIFAANTYQQFKGELNKLEEEKIDSLIIDLRGNSGGHLNVVKNMISLFLDASHVIYQTENKEGIEKSYSSGTVTKKYPIVILSNGDSASASEVMMGALKDEYGATIVGEASFGKGTVQELKTISSGNQYKFTTKKWLTPKGYWVNGKGIEPTNKITMNDVYFENPSDATDNQLQAALDILKK